MISLILPRPTSQLSNLQCCFQYCINNGTLHCWACNFGGFANAFIKENWCYGPEILSGFEPDILWLQSCDTSQYWRGSNPARTDVRPWRHKTTYVISFLLSMTARTKTNHELHDTSWREIFIMGYPCTWRPWAPLYSDLRCPTLFVRHFPL